MKTQRLLTILTLVTLVILMSLLIQNRPVEANNAAPILRGRGLEIVDGRGKVRASIQVVPRARRARPMVHSRKQTGRYTLKRCSFA